MQNETREQKLSILDAYRLAAALCIIVLHSFLEENDFMNIYGAEILGRWPVGLFFTISGFFLKDKIKDVLLYCIGILRIYVIWTVFYAVWFHLDIWGIKKFLSALRTGIIMPFWYFSSLIMCVLFVSILRLFIKEPRILCIVTGMLYVIAIMGCTLCYMPSVSAFMDRYFFIWHERIIGVHQTRNGLFNGSFFISIGILLRQKYTENRLAIKNRRLFDIMLILTIILHITEIILLISFHIGEADVLLISPALSAMIIILAFQYEMPAPRAELYRGMSNLIFISHCLFLDIFQRMQLHQWLTFIMTVISSLLFSYIIMMLSKRISLLKYLY